MKTISPVHLQQLLDSHSGLSLLDVRTPVEYAEVHVPQAPNEPIDQFDPDTLLASGQLPKDQPVYLLCRSGGRASKAAAKIAKEGFDNAVVVEGGTLAWIDAGLPVNRGTVKVISLERQVVLSPVRLFSREFCSPSSFILISSASPRSLVQDSSLPVSPIGAAWAFSWPSCPGTPRLDFPRHRHPSEIRLLPSRPSQRCRLTNMPPQIHRGLSWLVGELDSRGVVLDEPTALRLLTEANLSPAEVAPYVEERAGGHGRRCIVRRETYELLVLTWAPSQGSVAHDHSGSLCGLKVVQGCLTEQLFQQGPDGQVRKTTATRLGVEQILVDPGVVVHALGNDSDSGELLVTVHIYSPPLPEMRRYAVTNDPPAKLFLRQPPKDARVIVIVGGGFTGTMILANLLRFGSQTELPLHIVMIDRQPAFGEGIAYRTNDSRHLLNVPAGRMSAWPDLPDDFLSFAQARDPSVRPGDFLPRRIYGQYIRQTLRKLAESSEDRLSAEVIHDEATCLTPTNATGWSIQTAADRFIQADMVVITIGHRPPDDPLARRWIGPRHRYITDPWAALVLSQIGPDEPVLLLGSGLTAVDAILTLDRSDRVAPLIAVSRRGLMPLSHSREPKPAADVSELVARWLDPATRLTVRQLVSTLRRQVAAAEKAGVDWRQVIDGLRPVIPKLWEGLSISERRRFLSRGRSFWEVHRHRMSPDVADDIDLLRQKRTLEIVSGALVSAAADADGVDVTLSLRDGSTKRTVRVSWVINCTGPGVHNRHTTHPILRPLLEAGTLCEDELHLGLCTDSIGQAIDSSGRILHTLLVAGTLRKSTLWESTAIPELRQQAQAIAQTALATLLKNVRRIKVKEFFPDL